MFVYKYLAAILDFRKFFYQHSSLACGCYVTGIPNVSTISTGANWGKTLEAELVHLTTLDVSYSSVLY